VALVGAKKGHAKPIKMHRCTLQPAKIAGWYKIPRERYKSGMIEPIMTRSNLFRRMIFACVSVVLCPSDVHASFDFGGFTEGVAVRQLEEMYGGCLINIPTPGERFWSWASHVSGGLLADPLPDCSPAAMERMKAAWEAKHPQKPDDGLLMKTIRPGYQKLYPQPDACPLGYYEAAPVQPQPGRRPRICVELTPPD
jgi:hypothetical protein